MNNQGTVRRLSPSENSTYNPTSNPGWWPDRIFPALLFLFAFVPRVTALVGSETLWHDRAGEFIDAVMSAQWSGTYLAPHPGVTTMWLAGLARRAGLLFNPGYDGMSVAKRLNIELIPIALTISLGIVLAFLLLKRLFDFQVAAAAALLLAFDPYHLSISKVIHVDALVSTFMLLSALFLWLFLKENRWPWVLLSGVFAGLGLLTKTPALLLIPYFFLCMIIWQADRWQRGETQDFASLLRDVVKMTLMWVPALAAIYVVLWPAIWVKPLDTLALTFGGALFYSETPHENPVLFLGEATVTDPGPLFYPVNMAIKTTAVSLTGFLLSFFVFLRGRLRTYQRQALLLGFAFIFFFILMMTLGEKKLSRYILPALQFVTILAGIGWVYTLRCLWGERQQALRLSLVLLIGIQFLIAAARFPYFGTHYNYLLGGPKRILENEVVAGQEFGIGVELAADYLNDLPLSTELVVGAQNWLDFYHYFQGKTVPLTDDRVDYLLFTRNWTLRGTFDREWRAVWEKYREREPKLVISFDDVPYVWVYKTGPVIDEQHIANPLNVTIGDRVRLLGYEFSPDKALPGDTIVLTLYWEALQSGLGDYTVFTHLLDAGGQLRGQQDNQPQKGMYPTYLWDKGERLEDRYEISIDSDAPPGVTNFSVGMYILETLERLPIVTSEGESLPERSLLLPGPRVIAN
ncbi:MAG: ArnT family glycosyltransferase [Candidatus Promineifilaceae bacterium]